VYQTAKSHPPVVNHWNLETFQNTHDVTKPCLLKSLTLAVYRCIQTGYIALRRALRSENNHGAILKGCSKPKCSKLVTSKGPSEWKILKGSLQLMDTLGPYDPLHREVVWRHRMGTGGSEFNFTYKYMYSIFLYYCLYELDLVHYYGQNDIVLQQKYFIQKFQIHRHNIQYGAINQ